MMKVRFSLGLLNDVDERDTSIVHATIRKVVLHGCSTKLRVDITGYEEQQNKNDALDAQSDDEDSDEPDPGRRTRSASRRCLPERRGRSRKGSRGERPPSAAGPLGVQKKRKSTFLKAIKF